MDMVNCTPFARNWDPLIPGSFCRFGIPQFGLASATTNLVLDLIPLVLAQRIIWNLHISQKKKIGVSAIFLVGVTGCVASIVRLYYATRFYISDDTTYYFSIMALCSLCETTCAHLILCAPCIPKAIMGLKQTNTFKGLRRYTKNTTTYVNNPNIFRETNVNYRIRKPREHWFMSSKIPGNDITHSEDSERSLRQPTIN
ncbi:hypothetical protein F5Y04DRAFT_278958 [Hypomontagnella monticulosa]|nr:hypothetical protein F5Y04DRAFT_278958 [Hypomontagnella monticulosa]